MAPRKNNVAPEKKKDAPKKKKQSRIIKKIKRKNIRQFRQRYSVEPKGFEISEGGGGGGATSHTFS